jgi:CelD/BcsL family acetyltransferase involved in cellulose biosynthesis
MLDGGAIYTSTLGWAPTKLQTERRGGSIAVEAHEGGLEVLDGLADEWRGLCDQNPAGELFYRPAWTRAYVRAFKPENRLCVVTARIGGRLCALLPLIQESVSMVGLPARMLRGAGNVHTCRFDLVRVRGAEGAAAVAAVWSFLRESPEWDVIHLPFVPEEGTLPQVAALAQKDGFPVGRRESLHMPYISLVGASARGNVWSGPLNGRFRRDLRRRLRNLEGLGEVRLRRVARAAPEDLQSFYELERCGWKGQEGTAIACGPATRQFYDEIAQAADLFGYLSLYFLEVGGRPIAAHFGLTYKGRYLVPKIGYDETYARYSPGHLLVDAVLRDCAARGLTEFDFLGPAMNWKGCWTSLTRPHAALYIFAKTPLGRTLHAAKFGWKSAVKKLLAKASG